jgi:hypothetical protein
VSDAQLQPYLDIVKERLAAKASFEQAVRVGLLGILTSSEFLFLNEKPGPLDDYALASRLSYFLWSSMPDAELLKLAAAGELSKPGGLRRQVDRLLADPKSAAFVENFTGQWLNLRDIDSTAPDFRLYPEFDEFLKTAMVSETRLFFRETLDKNLSLANFVSSDFTFLNEKLATHYGIAGVDGPRMRRTTLPADSHRGGVLTMASVLKVTANGTTTSPVTRGAWVLDRILGTPPAPPPPDVPAVEPDIRGATTMREQLAKHRQIEACASCHVKIDPPGFALESFDVIGGYRENYRSLGRGKPVMKDGRRMAYQEGPPIDPADALADGRRFKNIDEFKKLLLADKDKLTRALATHLLTYATGGAVRDRDRDDVESIVRAAKDKDYGFGELTRLVVESKLFREK